MGKTIRWHWLAQPALQSVNQRTNQSIQITRTSKPTARKQTKLARSQLQLLVATRGRSAQCSLAADHGYGKDCESARESCQSRDLGAYTSRDAPIQIECVLGLVSFIGMCLAALWQTNHENLAQNAHVRAAAEGSPTFVVHSQAQMFSVRR